jgi:hypothetical protein
VLFYDDVPLAFYALGFCVVVAFVGGLRIDFGDAEGEQGKRKQFECVFSGGAVVDFREEGVL